MSRVCGVEDLGVWGLGSQGETLKGPGGSESRVAGLKSSGLALWLKNLRLNPEPCTLQPDL